MKHEVRKRLQARFRIRGEVTKMAIKQLGDMPPSTHSKRLKAKRKQSRRKGHG